MELLKSVLIGAVSAVVVGAILVFFVHPQVTQVTAGGTSTPAGSTGTTARQYNVFGVALSAPGTNGTSTSITNSSGQDLYITAFKAGCNGLGTSLTAYSGAALSALKVTVGTTSTAAPAAAPSAPLGGAPFTIATSSSSFGFSTSTVSGGASTSTILWANGQIMTFWVNATNTAVCTFGLDVTSA